MILKSVISGQIQHKNLLWPEQTALTQQHSACNNMKSMQGKLSLWFPLQSQLEHVCMLYPPGWFQNLQIHYFISYFLLNSDIYLYAVDRIHCIDHHKNLQWKQESQILYIALFNKLIYVLKNMGLKMEHSNIQEVRMKKTKSVKKGHLDGIWLCQVS